MEGRLRRDRRLYRLRRHAGSRCLRCSWRCPTHLAALGAYWLIAWLAPVKPIGLYQDEGDAKFWQGVRSNATRSTTEVRSKFRDIDRRLADIELHYTSRNTALASEIDSLR